MLTFIQGIGDFDSIEPDSAHPDMQVIAFKDRYTAEQFFYGSKHIPGVGKVELSWVTTPLPPATAFAKPPLEEGDVGMSNVWASFGGSS